MAGSISGLNVSGAAVCAVLVWSGFKGTTLADTFKALLQGNLNAPVTQGISTAVLASSTGAGSASIATQAQTYNNNANVAQKYVWGGAPGTVTGKIAGTDCSGFVNAVIGRDLGMSIPGGSYSGSAHGPNTDAWYSWSGVTKTTSPQAGDIVIYGPQGATVHMGIMTDSSNMISDTDPAQGVVTATATAGNPTSVPPAYFSVNAAQSAGTTSVTAGSGNQNLNTIGLTLHTNYGYSQAAAAGIAGCVAGESGGDPESQGSGGRGLIGWTPPSALPDSAFTGNASADLSAQIGEIDNYNKTNWSQYIPMLNAQTDPVAAADYYSQYFERPQNALSDVRSGVATSVYSYIGSH